MSHSTEQTGERHVELPSHTQDKPAQLLDRITPPPQKKTEK
jgi:hypothetical protein